MDHEKTELIDSYLDRVKGSSSDLLSDDQGAAAGVSATDEQEPDRHQYCWGRAPSWWDHGRGGRGRGYDPEDAVTCYIEEE